MSSSTHDEFDITARQNATNERSAAARLDRPTEDRLYRLYREFFQAAETGRRWNLWEDIPWDDVRTDPSPELSAAVVRLYEDELFLPDFSAKALAALRSSRGRAWFITRWSYEESKHLLALTEWLTRSGACAADDLRAQSDELLLRFAWEPPFEDAPAILADILLWELKELAHYREVRGLAGSAGDAALAAICDRVLRDEEAHRAFLRDSLNIIAEAYPERVRDAVHRVAAAATNADDGDRFVTELLEELSLRPAGE